MEAAEYLTQKEKTDTIPLWREAFPEDGQDFLDYYYKEKARNNRILAVREEETGRIVSMLHRNPYQLFVNGHTVNSDYIVAVATAEDKRHQGLMRMLLTRSFKDMHREGMPFCYLMPADRRIYEPFDFAYIYDQEHWRLTGEAEKRLVKQRVLQEDSQEVAKWMEEWLEKTYQVLAVRNQAYVSRLIKELDSEKGWMELLLDKGNPVGIRCLWGIHKKEQRMLLCDKEYREDIKEKTPAIMARITDVETCLRLIGLKENSPFDELEVILDIQDKVCPWNCGTFLWKIKKNRSLVIRLGEYGITEEKALAADEALPRLSIGIGSLAQWVFGYKEFYDLDNSKTDNNSAWWQSIGTWNGVFLDEVV